MYDFQKDQRFAGLKPLENRVPLASPTPHREDELGFIEEAYRDGWLTTAGGNIDAIESLATEYMGKPAVALANGTAALHLAVRLAAERAYGPPACSGKGAGGLLYGRRAFVSDMTFCASVNPVVYEGGEPVFIDSEYGTWNMDPAALERAFEAFPDVKVVVFAHLYGVPGRIWEVKRICQAHGALLVEDAAEAFGARVYDTSAGMPASGEDHICRAPVGMAGDCRAQVCGANADGFSNNESRICGAPAGAVGDYGILSFNGNKIITGSSGGMLLVPDEGSRRKAKKWATQSREDVPWYEHTQLGYNYRISNLVAGAVRGQWGHLEGHIQAKREIYCRYRKGLKGIPATVHGGGNYWLTCLLIDEAAACRGDYIEFYGGKGTACGGGCAQPYGSKGAIYGGCGGQPCSSKMCKNSHPQHCESCPPGQVCPALVLGALAAFGAEGRPAWKPMHLQPLYRANAFVTAEGAIYGKGSVDAPAWRGVSTDLFRRGLCLPSDIKMDAGQERAVVEVVRRCFGVA